MHLGLTVIVSTLMYLQVVSAQFGNFFQHAFGGHQQQQQHQTASSMWAATAAQVPCSTYLCPVTLDCVRRPSECPCPNPEDVKCIIPDSDSRGDGTVICVRGEAGCKAIERKIKP